MFESKDKPLISRGQFYRRILRSVFYAGILVAVSLLVGVLGYHWIGKLGWVDSLLNSSMILTGMGPVSPMKTIAAKLFASFYAIFSGIAFLTTAGVMLAPIAHRILHKFHLDTEDSDNGND